MFSVMPLFHGFGLGVGIHTALQACLLYTSNTVESAQKYLDKKGVKYESATVETSADVKASTETLIKKAVSYTHLDVYKRQSKF